MAGAANPDGGGPRVVLLGPPGSGKGTQAELLAARLGVPAISTGELLREAVRTGTPLGERVRDVMDAGRLVEDGLMAEVVAERLRRADARRGFLLDGYPRNPAQAQTLASLLAADGVDLDAVLLLAAPDPVLVERVRGRGRHDDRAEVIAARLRIFREQTGPLIAFYRQRGLLRELDGDRPREAVTADIVAALGAGA